MIKNTSYKVQVDVDTDEIRNSYNIEEGAYVTTESGVWTVYGGEWVKLYPQAGGETELGWVRYQDTEYTSSNKLSLSDENPVLLSNNGGIKTKSDTSQEYFNTATQKLIPSTLNDVYMISIEFKSSAHNTQNTHLDLWFENGGGLLENLYVSLGYYKGNNSTQTFHKVMQYYVDQDFIDNLADIKIQSHGGNALVWDIQFFIQKTQSYA